MSFQTSHVHRAVKQNRKVDEVKIFLLQPRGFLLVFPWPQVGQLVEKETGKASIFTSIVVKTVKGITYVM